MINNVKQALNDTLDQMDLILPSESSRNHFFSSAHGTFSRIDHILGHKSSLVKFNKVESISNIFSNHDVMKLQINYRKKIVKKMQTHEG